MNQILDPPNNYDFGLDFNYALWLPGTVATLVNVPWNNDYRDVVKFANRAKLNEYIDSVEGSGIRIGDLSYIKPNNPIRIDIPFNVALRHNYIRVSNPPQAIPGDQRRDFYYFITDVKYVAPNTTEIVVQLDIFQTFIYDFKFGNSFIERGHIGIANENAFTGYGRDYLTVPEGLNVGSEYQVVAKRRERLIESKIGGLDNLNYAVMVVSTADLFADYGDKVDPDIKVPGMSDLHGMPVGAGMYVFRSTPDFHNFMLKMRDASWVAQSIISITMIPRLQRYFSDVVWSQIDSTSPGLKINYVILNSQFEHNLPTNKLTKMFADWRNSADILNNIPLKYRHLKKFLTFPYMCIEVTTWMGTPIILKPESWANADADFTERVNLIPPAQRVNFIPRSYNAKPGAAIDANGDDNGDFLDLVATVDGFPSFPAVNDAGAVLLAQGAAGRAWSFDSANWSQQRALRSNEVAYDQGQGAVQTGQRVAGNNVIGDSALTSLGNVTAAQQSMIGGIGGIAGGAASGMRGGPAGAAAGAGMGAMNALGGAASMAVQNAANTQALGIRTTQNLSNAGAVAAQGNLVNDTNKDLSDWAARGDYENTIAGINSKVEDIRLTQPSMLGQFGGEVMNVLYDNSELNVRWKMLDQSYIRAIGDYWLRYGYAVNRFAVIPESLMTMEKFTYWKLKETYVVSAPMPETIKQGIRGLFEKGVTVYAKPEYIGTIDLGDNAPLEGISY